MNKYIILLVLFMCVVVMAISADNRRITIAYEGNLPDGWKKKINESVCEIMDISTNEEPCHFIIPLTNSVGTLYYGCEFWACSQFTNASLECLSALIDKKIPPPFRDKIVVFYGTPTDGGLYISTNGVP